MRLFRRVAFVCLAGSLFCSACGETGAVRTPSVSGPTPLSLAPLAGTPLAMLGQEVGARSSHPELAKTIITVVLTALHRGATGSGSVLRSPRWNAECPRGGGARIELPDNLPFIGEVSLVNTTTIWTDCVAAPPMACDFFWSDILKREVVVLGPDEPDSDSGA